MTTEIKVPQLPESITDATLVAWHKKPGDAVRRDENLADLETDKVVLEVPAPANGVLREVKVATGTVVTAGQLLALVEEGAQAQSAAAAKEAPPAEELKATGTEGGRDKEKLSPSVRRLIEENRLDAAAIPASGRDGRLTKSDVVDFLGRKQVATPAAVATAPAAPAQAPGP
ncbi:MAG TPA: biotin/lipoyl-containing protein, partial [Steroidobacteraceae bacterium]|nr:biotin/lipoyl-containing protein [Steroidobacteraceae bacterium]